MGLREDRFQRLLMLAGEICISTPARQQKYTRSAQVPWAMIHELRQLVTALGIDLDNARAMLIELQARERAKTNKE